MNVRVTFSRLPDALTPEEKAQLFEDVNNIIADTLLQFLDEPIDAYTMHLVRRTVGNALRDRYGDYYPEVMR